MNLTPVQASSPKIDDIIDHARQKMAAARNDAMDMDLVSDFIRQFYGSILTSEIEDRSLETLYGAARSVFSFGQKRQRGLPQARVFNPSYAEDGWTSEHTVIEIVHDDMPFLVDSIAGVLNKLDQEIFILVHPVFSLRRDDDGKLAEIFQPKYDGEDAVHESIMHIEITRQTDANVLQSMQAELLSVLQDVQASVEDWQAMRQLLADAKTEVFGEACTPEDREYKIFLEWLRNHHFTLLGARSFNVDTKDGRKALLVDPKSGLGILRNPDRRVFAELQADASHQVQERIVDDTDQKVIVTKSDCIATVHRPVAMDTVVIKRFDENNAVVGVWMFVGLFTADVYTNSPLAVPILRKKIEQVITDADYKKNSHDNKKLLSVLENLPRDEIFQSSQKHLQRVAMGIMRMQKNSRVALYVRKDQFQRFVSCLVYLPRDRFDTPLRLKIQNILTESFNGEISSYYTQLADSPQARLHIIINTHPGSVPSYDPREIENKIASVVRAWEDQLREALTRGMGEERAAALLRDYSGTFPSGYRENFDAEAAMFDIEQLETVLATGELGLNLYRPLEAPKHELRLKIYRAGHAITLSDMLPMLEHMGLKVVEEIPYHLRLQKAKVIAEDAEVWIHDFGMNTENCGEVDISVIRRNFQEALSKVWTGELESDSFNRLVIAAQMTWREITIFRAYGRYLRQVLFPFSQDYLSQALLENAGISRKILELFHIRNDPFRDNDNRAEASEALEAEILADLDAVESADHDRILRRFLNLVLSTLRTNYYQRDEDGNPKPTLAFKLSGESLSDLPKPRPWVETYVYSPRIEAVHLRGGKVARGGIRWSDRPEDFRTEVLGLIKAQMVKNAVIVPVGAKGGFIVKRPPASGTREAMQEEGIACYKLFMRSLLGMADNLIGGEVIPPKDVVRHDPDDPYLVVAADKGTATFSDIANAESQAAGFWLGDAFASGGSQGYDHKAMGITARGAWESVKRHFRELGTDVQTQPFTAVAVGDMGGDVFGNGMLQSRFTKLVGAFNHMHIFIDPDPDPAKSYDERKRLFETPRTTWADYNPDLLSKGGMVYSRSAKTVKLTPEIKALLDLDVDTITPNDLIRAVLSARVDLLFFGGIGTYMRSHDETDAEVGDRANDAVRIEARNCRAKVVGEGANLGVTQLARIEYAQCGGHINTDAIDNAGGVNCSDHEVNIKILLNEVVGRGDMTVKQRNILLEDMTDEVAKLVLRDNYLQTQALSMMEASGPDRLDEQARLIRFLERSGRLDRAIEFLPDEEELNDRMARRAVLTRSEASVVMPYCKLWLFDEIIQSSLPQEDVLQKELLAYFPKPIQAKFKDDILNHRLRPEIVTTIVTNSMVNRVGGTFLTEMLEETARYPSDIARAYWIVREAFGLNEVWDRIEALDNKATAEAQLSMLISINRFIRSVASWILRNIPAPIQMQNLYERLHAGVKALLPEMEEIDIEASERAQEWSNGGVPDDLVRRVLALDGLVSVPDVVILSETHDVSIPLAAKAYDVVGERFGFVWLRQQSRRLPVRSHWQKLAMGALLEDFFDQQRCVSGGVLNLTRTAGNEDVSAALDTWITDNYFPVMKADRLLNEYRESVGKPDLAMLTVAARLYRTMSRT